MRSIVPLDHPALRAKASEVPLANISSPFIQELIADMRALLAAERLGVAIAAPQVGEALRIFVVSGRTFLPEPEDGSSDADAVPVPDDLIFINPEIIKVSRRKKDLHEGCLSLPGFWGLVPRAERTTIRAYDEHGTQFTRGASGLLAHIFQHEIDHLDGILYTDKAHDVYEESPDHHHDTAL